MRPDDEVRVDHGTEDALPKPPEPSAELQEAMTAAAVNSLLAAATRAQFMELQMLALDQCMRILEVDGRNTVFPVTANGAIVDEEVAFNPALALNLTQKALQFILSPSTADGSPQQ